MREDLGKKWTALSNAVELDRIRRRGLWPRTKPLLACIRDVHDLPKKDVKPARVRERTCRRQLQHSASRTGGAVIGLGRRPVHVAVAGQQQAADSAYPRPSPGQKANGAPVRTPPGVILKSVPWLKAPPPDDVPYRLPSGPRINPA